MEEQKSTLHDQEAIQKEPDGQEAPEGEEVENTSEAEEVAGESAQAEAEDFAEKADGSKPKDAQEQETGEDAEGSQAKSFSERMAARKQAKQDKKTDELKERIAELEDKTKRQLAEFENFRRRTEKEKQAMFETGARSVIEKILPIIDNFERGLATVPPEKQEDPFVNGMNRIYKQFLSELDKIGVKPIEAVGKEFDPNLHNAVMQVDSEEYEAGTVAQELQKGYTYRDSVVRHSMVGVVRD